MNKNLDFARSQSAALILGEVLTAIFPKALLYKADAFENSFYYEFSISQEMTQEHLSVIQEKMLESIEKQDGFYPLEMVPKNGAELFKHQGQIIKAFHLKNEKAPLVHLVRIGQHYDLAPEIYQKKFEGALRLTHFEKSSLQLPIGEFKTFRLFGLAAADKQALKKCFQKKKEIEKVAHLEEGKKQLFFDIEEQKWIFLPKGALVLERLLTLFNALFEKYGFQKSSCLPFSEKLFLKSLVIQRGEIGGSVRQMNWRQEIACTDSPFQKGLFSILKGTQNIFGVLTSRKELKEECIYCLKFYLEIIKILGFSYEVEVEYKNDATWIKEVLKDCSLSVEGHFSKGRDLITLSLLDRWGRSFEKLPLKIEAHGEQVLLLGSVTASLEKLFGWLLEERLGCLPKEISPREVLILPVAGVEKFAQELYQYFKKNQVCTTLDSTNEKLSAKLHRALVQKRAYTLIIGEKEQREGRLTLRRANSQKEERLTQEELLEELRTT